MRTIRALAVAAFLALSGTAASASQCDDFPGQPCDLGGGVFTRASEVYWRNVLGQSIRIRGYCASACTMYLGVNRVCVDRNAVLGFHSATVAGRISRGVNRFMAGYYPDRLAEWFLDGQASRSTTIIRLTARQLSRRGVRICED